MKSVGFSTIAATLILQSFSVQGAEEFQESIPIEVAEAQLGFGGGGNLRVYSGIVEEFPEFQLPARFEVLGSSDRSGALTLSLVTPLDEEDARAAITDSFAEEGWIELPGFDMPRQEYGFVSANAPERPSFRQLCHDDFGQMTISYRDRGGRNFLSLSNGSVFGGDFRTCAERIAQLEESLQMSRRSTMAIYDYMPLLVVPEEARQGRMPFMRAGGGRSSGNSAETETTFTLDWELEEVYRHFADQIVEQGWTRDVESTGAVTATGTWVQQAEDGSNLVARLNVVNSEEDRFDLTLSVEGPRGRSGIGVRFGN